MSEAERTIRIRQLGALARVRAQALALGARPQHGLAVLGGCSLPASVGQSANGAARALAIGPTDWLLVSARIEARVICDELRAITEPRLAVVDVSDAVVTIEVSGNASRTVLAAGCGLDLHPQVLRAGQCARTRFADLAVIVDCIDDANRFELHVSRSYAAWLLDWLIDAAGPGASVTERAPE